MYHHRLSILFLLAAAPLSNLATPLAPRWDDMQMKHMWNSVPKNWESLGHPPAGKTIDLHMELKPHREMALIDALYEVSDPGHPKYGAHLSREQVAELVAPHPDTLGLVYSWLKHHGVSSSISMTHGGGWLTVTGVPVSQANDLLGASYQLYRHTGTNKTILRTVGYALPATLHEHVQTVAPTTYFSLPRKLQQTPRKRSREEAEPEEVEHVTLEFLRWLYSTEAYVPVAMDRNVLGVPGFLGQSPRQKDLTEFMNVFRIDAQNAKFTILGVNGGKYDASDPSIEASMNIQYAEGMAYPTPHIFYTVGGVNSWSLSTKEPSPDDSDFVWLNYLLSRPNIRVPQTITISYDDDERELPREYAKAICNLFARLGVRGVSILVASGNNGVGEGECNDPDSSKNGQFRPTFPASCSIHSPDNYEFTGPWVTSVGGTTSHEPEVAAEISGGGFSFHFRRPKYQKSAVPAFLGQLEKDKYIGLFNLEGRGIPDIAAQALNFLVVVDPELHTVGSTSCSATTVAGIISLLNDHLLAGGKDPLGFLNPWLYSLGRGGLNDIIFGSNPGCNTDGFDAIVGWDPVTGLGTPDFEKLQRTLANRKVVSSISVPPQSSTPSTDPSTPTCISC